ncbi:AAA family ATPase [Neomoorella mulderi]|uniref:Stage 0 sporulation protein A homolog n=1 Tax=Moorella mulderi DSM 14980 TaxID=1122241 RepID=A0A151AZX5_9FIRM|nr:response regulator [Moorella mulderi]KYH32957.1 transcriptional regulatory protein DegU [Moorella mulderi DSM 14980]
MSQTSVLIVDDISTTREDIKRLLYFEEDIKVIGEASDGEEAVRAVEALRPDVVLMDINMPGMDGIAASEAITSRVPETAVVIISIQKESEYLRKAMAAGARDYLVKPFTSSDLAETIRRVGRTQKQQILQLRAPAPKEAPQTTAPANRMLVVFSSKGGVGKTTLACNLAVSLARETRQKVALVDLNLQSGNVALMLNILPQGTIAELVQEEDRGEISLVDNYLYPHLSGLKVLPAPLKPEQAEVVAVKDIEAILKLLKGNYAYTVVDTAPAFNDLTLSALDLADDILLVFTPDLPALKCAKTDLEVLERLNQATKVKAVLNKSTLENGISLAEIKQSLGVTPLAILPRAEKMVLASVNRGHPFVLTHPGSVIAQRVKELAENFMPAAMGKRIKGRQKRFFFLSKLL